MALMMDEAWVERGAAMLADAAGNAPAQRGAAIALRRLGEAADDAAREWVRGNNDPEYGRSRAHELRQRGMRERLDDVEWELGFFYGATVDWPGLYPTVTCADGRVIYF